MDEEITNEAFRTLPEEVMTNGHRYVQVERKNPTSGDPVAIYEQWTKTGNPKLLAWEVVKIKSREAIEIMGKLSPAGEMYPNSNQWGTSGWTCQTLAAAEKRMASILEAKP